MLTLEVLICTINKGIVRVNDIILPPQPNIRYIVSFQYTDERYLDLIPAFLAERKDVTLLRQQGEGLSRNRNRALEQATADLVMFADDDTRLVQDNLPKVLQIFEGHPKLDIAFFQAETYTGRPLKSYPDTDCPVVGDNSKLGILAIEMVCRRESIQGRMRFDERFGLGTKFLTCGEERIWLEDAHRLGLTMHYYPLRWVESSTMLKKKMVYVDAGVQRSKGAITYYIRGRQAWWICFQYALRSAAAGYCHFWPMWRHLAEGIRYMRRNRQ